MMKKNRYQVKVNYIQKEYKDIQMKLEIQVKVNNIQHRQKKDQLIMIIYIQKLEKKKLEEKEKAKNLLIIW